MPGDDIAIDPPGFLGEPFDKARAIGDLTLGLGQRLALLDGEDGSKIVPMFDHEIEPGAQQVRPLLGRAGGPAFPSDISSFDSTARCVGIKIGDVADDFTRSRIGHRDAGFGRRLDPFAGHIGRLP
ncbi:hypothetical protein D9M68_906320 [compost metagenome]